MFRYVSFDSWNGLIPLMSFAVTLVIFGLFFVRAIRLKRPDAARMAQLPLEDDAPASVNNQQNSSHE